jgi:light-regulated signal transduction histidine kinase (bacteriophytochrome)
MPEEESYPRLISLAVHELRTPVGVLGGYLRMLGMDSATPLSDRQRHMLEEASKACTRLTALIAELSDVAKLDDGSIAIARLPLELFPLVEEAAAHIEIGDDRGVLVEPRGHAAGARLRGDRDRLRAALRAIFTAIAREKPGPTVIVAERLLTHVDGKAMAAIVVCEEHETAEVHAAGRAPFDEKRGGVALALALARRVIEAHGGHLWSPAFDDARRSKSAAIVSLPIDA